MPSEGLTKQDELFISEYFNNGFNATRAYETVFKPKVKASAKFCAYKLMNKSIIKKEVEKLWDEVKELNIIRKEETVMALKTLMDNAIEREDNQTLLKTIDIINKMSGAYTLQIDASIANNIILTIPGLEPEEIKEDEE